MQKEFEEGLQIARLGLEMLQALFHLQIQV
jgi:hypothetical protein